MSLGTKPENAGLFPDDKGNRKAAIDRCLIGPPILLEVVRIEDVKVAGKTRLHRFVTITVEGIQDLLQQLAPDRIVELLCTSAPQMDRQLKELQGRMTRLVDSLVGTTMP